MTYLWFQHTATRRWLPRPTTPPLSGRGFNTQPPEGGCTVGELNILYLHKVSTHSHPKVAAGCLFIGIFRGLRFNTQPPEGGCTITCAAEISQHCFNTQPPEGGCMLQVVTLSVRAPVSTHSHPKVAAPYIKK